MALQQYITPQDVIDESGRLALVFGQRSPRAQLALCDRACRRFDRLTGQSGGLSRQLGKVTTTSPLERSTSLIWLPNKPVTNISAIHVQPTYGTAYDYTQITLGQTVYLDTNGYAQGFRYVVNNVTTALPFGADVFLQAFQEGDMVTVTYDCGFDASTLPSDVQEACLMILSGMLFQIRDNPAGANDVQVEQAKQTWSAGPGLTNTISAAVYDLVSPFTCRMVPS